MEALLEPVEPKRADRLPSANVISALLCFCPQKLFATLPFISLLLCNIKTSANELLTSETNTMIERSLINSPDFSNRNSLSVRASLKPDFLEPLRMTAGFLGLIETCLTDF